MNKVEPEKLDLVKKAISKLEKKSKKCRSIDDFLDLVFSFKVDEISIEPIQIKNEIRTLIKILERKKPKTVVEIGTAKGGTLFLLCQVSDPRAKIVSIDLPDGPFGGEEYQDWKIPFYKSFARKNQSIKLIRTDSQSTKTLKELKKILGKKKIDFLLIDGDHSYKGVKKDFKMYGPLLSKDGLMVFHDINSGPKINVGGVPKLWKEVKDKFIHGEIVDDYNSGIGYGVGILSSKLEGKISSSGLEFLKTIVDFKKEQVSNLQSKLKEEPLGSLLSIYSQRNDLQKTFPEVKEEKYSKLIEWAANIVTKSQTDPSSFKLLKNNSKWYINEFNNSKKQSSLISNLKEKENSILNLENIKKANSKRIKELISVNSLNIKKIND